MTITFAHAQGLRSAIGSNRRRPGHKLCSRELLPAWKEISTYVGFGEWSNSICRGRYTMKFGRIATKGFWALYALERTTRGLFTKRTEACVRTATQSSINHVIMDHRCFAILPKQASFRLFRGYLSSRGVKLGWNDPLEKGLFHESSQNHLKGWKMAEPPSCCWMDIWNSYRTQVLGTTWNTGNAPV